MFDKMTEKNILDCISAAVTIRSFVVGSQLIQPSLAQDLSQQVQLKGSNQTGNQTSNQSALLCDPAKMYVPSQPID